MAVHCVKNHFRRTYFDKFMPTYLRGQVFFMKHSVLAVAAATILLLVLLLWLDKSVNQS